MSLTPKASKSRLGSNIRKTRSRNLANNFLKDKVCCKIVLSVMILPYQVAVCTFCKWSNSAMSAASARNALMVARPRTDEARCEKSGERATPSRRCTDLDVAT